MTVIVSSVPTIVAASHDEGDHVTVTGVLNGVRHHKSVQGSDWVTAYLHADGTALVVAVYPETFAAFGELLGPYEETTGTWRPPTLQLTGRVGYVLAYPTPGLIVDSITRSCPAPVTLLRPSIHCS
ncbi:hypothetical protein [Spirillospora sp. NBC_01491]|uniref:hypothetical protein n=1 Tax=Spirillospora sp. NBC_01491 TaxID=2976007 RepID=UPI002E314102|nr:hypothetical protein [Spirillospora sp. NBC_01491]